MAVEVPFVSCFEFAFELLSMFLLAEFVDAVTVVELELQLNDFLLTWFFSFKWSKCGLARTWFITMEFRGEPTFLYMIPELLLPLWLLIKFSFMRDFAMLCDVDDVIFGLIDWVFVWVKWFVMEFVEAFVNVVSSFLNFNLNKKKIK